MDYELQTGSHSVYALQYHLVTVTKYRTPVLTPAILRRFRTLARDIAADYGCEVSDINGDLDHAHLLFRGEPENDLEDAPRRVSRPETPTRRRALATGILPLHDRASHA